MFEVKNYNVPGLIPDLNIDTTHGAVNFWELKSLVQRELPMLEQGLNYSIKDFKDFEEYIKKYVVDISINKLKSHYIDEIVGEIITKIIHDLLLGVDIKISQELRTIIISGIFKPGNNFLFEYKNGETIVNAYNLETRKYNIYIEREPPDPDYDTGRANGRIVSYNNNINANYYAEIYVRVNDSWILFWDSKSHPQYFELRLFNNINKAKFAFLYSSALKGIGNSIYKIKLNYFVDKSLVASRIYTSEELRII